MLYDFLQKRMRQFPKQTIADENVTLTYAEALSIAEKFAKELNMEKVGVLCLSELNTGLGLLACFKAGVTAVPLSMRYGEAHVGRIVQHMGLSHIITDESGELAIKQIAESAPEKEDLSDVALIMCTSGTTGAPKGAMLTHENILTNLQDIGLYFDINQTDTILIARPLYHCAVLTGEFLISLCRGLNIHFYNGEFNPLLLIQEITVRKATVLGGTPTLFYHLCLTARRGKETLPLRVVAVSGECMTETAAKAMRAAMPDTEIYSVYGLTEAGPRVSALPPELFDKYPRSVGFPLKNVEAKIENGELLIRGKSVMKGYYNDPIQTKKVLVPPSPNSWLLSPDSCFLRTGDGAVIDKNGMITIKGRLDNMLIRAGMNIFPQEIENALKSAPRVTDALVYGEQNGITQRIYAKIEAKGLSKSDVMAICRERLPAYEIPDAVEIVDSLPRNASGKLIRPRTGGN